MAVAPIFVALGDETRLELVRRLATEGPMRTGELVEGLGMSRQAATKHLVVLEGAGVVRSEKQGREIVRSLDPRIVGEASAWLRSRAMEWEMRLGRLRELVEAESNGGIES